MTNIAQSVDPDGLLLSVASAERQPYFYRYAVGFYLSFENKFIWTKKCLLNIVLYRFTTTMEWNEMTNLNYVSTPKITIVGIWRSLAMSMTTCPILALKQMITSRLDVQKQCFCKNKINAIISSSAPQTFHFNYTRCIFINELLILFRTVIFITGDITYNVCREIVLINSF